MIKEYLLPINLKMRFITLLLFLAGKQIGFTQVSTDSISYKNDLIIYRQALEQAHPSLYRFTPKDKYDALFDSIESNLTNKTTELDFFRSVSQISSLIREGHTYIQPPESLISSIVNKNLFPFGVLVEDNRIIVRNSRSPQLDYLKKTTIDSINGQSIESILNRFEEYASTVSTFNNSRLTKTLSLYNNFAVAYYYFLDTTSNFRIAYRPNPKATSTSIELEGSSNQFTKLSYPELPPEPKPPFFLDINEQQSTATMTISSFAYWVIDKKIKDYAAFFEESFITLKDKGIEYLIIDLRGNRGGEEMIAGDLLTYLIDYEFQIYKYCKAKTLNFSFTNSLPNSNKIKLSKINYIATDSGFVMKKADFLRSYSPKKQHGFKGRTYVLSNGLCASACNIFLAMVKTHKVGTIIGQESGGAYEDVDGRLRISFNLPYSGIFVSFPAWSMKLNTSGGDKQKGVIPDHETSPTIEDIISGKDSEMEFIEKLISKKSE